MALPPAASRRGGGAVPTSAVCAGRRRKGGRDTLHEQPPTGLRGTRGMHSAPSELWGSDLELGARAACSSGRAATLAAPTRVKIGPGEKYPRSQRENIVTPILSVAPRSPRRSPDLGRLCRPDLRPRRGGRVVECTALEMRHRCKPIGGSNPSLSASCLKQTQSLPPKTSFPQLPDRRCVMGDIFRVR